MDPSVRRRRHGVELGLGLLAPLACLWLLSRPERQGARSGAARPDGEAAPVVRREAALDPAPFEGVREVERAQAVPIHFRIDQPPRSTQLGREWTDDAGAVELLVLGPQRSEFRHDIELWVLGPRPRRATLILPEELGHPTDLGDVVFRPAPPGSVPPDR